MSVISKILAFTKENPVLYFASVDGDRPRVRPFGSIMEFEGKLYMGMGDYKESYRHYQSGGGYIRVLISRLSGIDTDFVGGREVDAAIVEFLDVHVLYLAYILHPFRLAGESQPLISITDGGSGAFRGFLGFLGFLS